jgi:vancomycin resistance protein YoaR
LALAGAVGLGSALAGPWIEARAPSDEDFALLGAERAPEQALDVFLARREAEIAERSLRVVGEETVSFGDAEGEVWRVEELPLGSLGVRLDVPATRAAWVAAAQARSWRSRVEAAAAPRPELTPVRPVFTIDTELLRRELERLAPRFESEPRDARIELALRRRVPDRAGRRVDIARTVARLEAALAEGEPPRTLELAVTRVPAQVQASALLAVDPSRVLGSQETDFAGTGRGRAVNIGRAAHLLNGTVIGPGETLSFNRVVGKRTLENGFTWAPVIFDDELQPGIGGGVCQVASTLHAAAVLGGLEVVRRRPHSRPSSYIRVGLDAVVVDGDVDLVLRNPFEVPLIVSAFLPTPHTLRVEVLGREPPGVVRYTYSITERAPYGRRLTVKPWLGDKAVRKQKGHDGFLVESWVRIAEPNGTERVRRYRSDYRPTPEVFWIGPEARMELLPELPEGSPGVERMSAEESEARADG